MLFVFILLQVILLFFMLFHDWIAIPPFNDVAAIKQADGNWGRLFSSFINGIVVIIPLMMTIKYYHQAYIPHPALKTIIVFYLILTIGTILSWWVPYFWGSSKKHKQHFVKFSNMHRFLSARGDNVIPNTLHIVLHLQVWACLVVAFSLYYFG